MLRHTGRAAIEVGKNLHRLCHVLITVAVVLTVAVLASAWRLSHGPVDVGFLRDRVEKAVNKSISPARVTIGGASIAWGGFSHGLDQPLVLRLTNVTIDTTTGSDRVQIPAAEATLSARWLLIGRVLPRSLTLEGARVMLVRKSDGSLNVDIGGTGEATGPSPLNGLLAVLGAPTQTDMQVGGGRLSQLSAVSIHGATLRLDDHLLGMTWSANPADIDLTRHKGGGMDGKVTLVVALGDQHALLEGSFNLSAGARSAHAVARLGRVTPNALAAVVPALEPLAAFDMPMTLDGSADFGPELTPTHIRLTARAEAGKLNTKEGSIPIRRANITLEGTLEQMAIQNATVELQPGPDAAISILHASGQLTDSAGQRTAALHLTLDHLEFADLPALWPADLNPPTRAWITENMTSGSAYDGKADLVLESSDAAPEVHLVSATATLEGNDISVTWVPTVPPVEHAKAHLVLTDPDKIEIDVKSARQKVNGADPIPLQNGHVTITGMSQKDQVLTVRVDANASIPSALALLKEPRLRLLDKHPMDLRGAAGDARMTIQAVVPLEIKLSADDVAIRGTGNLSKAHLTGVLAGRDLDDGTFSLDVDTNHLSLKGTGRVAGIPANIEGMMDFRPGPPSQVTQRFTANGRATDKALTAAGIDTAGALTGDVGLNVILNEYRSGDGDLTADADLTQSALNVSPLAWRKPAGTEAHASGRLILTKDKLTGIDRVTMDGPATQVRGAVTVFGGRLDTVRLDRLALGRTDVKGTIRLPRDGPIGIDVTGPALDLSAKILEKPSKRDPAAPEPPPGPAWSMRGRFDRVFLAHDHIANQVAVSADTDGTVFHALSITGKLDAGKAISAQIAQVHGARRLTMEADDAGSLLNGLDITDSIMGGALTIAGNFDDTTRKHTFSGTLNLTDFRASRAPALGKLLQAVTLYGLVDALGGPGLSFSRLTAPFQLDDDTLTLHDARAFSPSLGVTVQGQLDRTADRLDLEGTLVPAYVFNSLLGKLPLIGGLFSAEKGGGLFAMNYSLHGPMDNPTVIANPLSALTPGILRGMFGLFSQAPLDQPASPGNARQP